MPVAFHFIKMAFWWAASAWATASMISTRIFLIAKAKMKNLSPWQQPRISRHHRYPRKCIDGINEKLKGVDYDVVVGPESRGFIFGVPVAYANGKGFVPVRKKGKLPCETISQDYELEYGTATIEMHKDAIVPGQKVVIVDDLIATGGTTEAIIKLIEQLGGEVVKIIFLIELGGA